MTKVEQKGIEIIPTTFDQVTKLNAATKERQFDRTEFRRNAELNRERFVKSVQERRQKVASREKD